MKRKQPRDEETKRSGPDRFECYELAVTSPGPLARFLKAVHGGSPRVLGEDFSGTAALARAWVAMGGGKSAVAVDKDPEALARVTEVRTPRRVMPPKRKPSRIKAVCSDVMRAKDRCDIIAATNFPICYWHTRRDLVRYLKHARSRLSPRGIFVADLYGGSDAFQTGSTTLRIRTPRGVLSYTWEQRAADPKTGRVLNALHFRIGGRTMRDAFVYDWRLWSIPELAEAMIDAGFRSAEVYDSLGDAVDQHGDVYVRPAAELDDPFVVYVVGRT